MHIYGLLKVAEASKMVELTDFYMIRVNNYLRIVMLYCAGKNKIIKKPIKVDRRINYDGNEEKLQPGDY